MKEEIVLITGASGHLGNVTVKELIKKNYKIRTFDIIKNNKINFDSNNVEEYYGDICNKNDVEKLFLKLENYKITVIHCAGIVTIATKHDDKIYNVNVNGTKNIIDLCKKYDVKKLIYISSVHAITEKPNKEIIEETNEFNPNEVEGLYAKTKAEATKLVVESELNYNIINPSGIIGPYDYGNGHFTELIIDYMKQKLTAIVKGGYSFVDVRDVAEAIVSAIENGGNKECYIVANGYFEIIDILDKIHKITNVKKIKTIIPNWFAKLTAPLAELYYKILKQTPLYTKYSLYTLTNNSNFCNKKAIEKLKIKIRPIEETLRDTLKWLKNQNRIKY